VLQRGVPPADLEQGGLRIGPVWDLDNGSVRFGLEVHVWDTEQGLSTSFIYNADLFDASAIGHLEQQFAAVLQGMAADPDTGLPRLPLVGEEGGALAEEQHGDELSEALAGIGELSDSEVDALLREMTEAQAGGGG